MELRQRTGATGRRDERGPLKDVALGPTVYAGERYGKMSERIRRQQRRPADVEKTTNRLLTPRLIGFLVALAFIACVVLMLKYRATQRQIRRKQRGF